MRTAECSEGGRDADILVLAAAVQLIHARDDWPCEI